MSRTRLNIDTQTLSEMTAAIADYEKLISYFPQLDPKQETLKEFWEDFKKKYQTDKSWQSAMEAWDDVDVHIVKQIWSSTSGGWGGMGGAAMSSYHTVIIENKFLGIVAVYYSGKLAYILHIDEDFRERISGNYAKIPPLYDLKGFSVIYKKR